MKEYIEKPDSSVLDHQVFIYCRIDFGIVITGRTPPLPG